MRLLVLTPLYIGWLVLGLKNSHKNYKILQSKFWDRGNLRENPVSVDLRVSRIYRHLAASPSFGRADTSGVAFCRRQLSALQTMEMTLDGDKYD